MIKLLSLEFLKNKSNISFWIFLAIYLVAVYVVCSAGTVLMNATMELTASGDLGEAPPIPQFTIYEFPNIWHNLSYAASFTKIILAIIIIVNITNEISQRTLRQNIIDGLSKGEFLVSKILFSVVLMIIATIGFVAISLYLGFQYSGTTETDAILSNMGFIGGYMVEILGYMGFAVFMSIALRKAGMAIVIVFAYSMLFEPFFGWMLLDSEGLLINLLPINSLDNIITLPFSLTNPDGVQTAVQLPELAIALGWTIAFYAMSYTLLLKRDW
ncbi:MAG: ABC transporter permease [Reichenbachiella sp.]